MRHNTSPIRTITFLVDLLLINLGFIVAHTVRYDFQFPGPILTYHSLVDYGFQQLLLNGLLLFTFWGSSGSTKSAGWSTRPPWGWP